MKHHLQCAEQQRCFSDITADCACHTKWLSWLIRMTHETSFTMRGATEAFLRHHRRLRLPHKMTLMIDPHDTWNVIYNARSNRGVSPTSPNIAPATQNDSHDWSSSHMKRYLQCAEQQVSSSNITEYCACHAKWLSKISNKFLENSWNVIYNPGPIREWSERDPATTTRLATEVTFRARHELLYWKIQHFALGLSFQISLNTAPATKSDSPTSPNTAPATQSDCHDWSLSHMKRYLQCAEQQMTSSNITEYCACHAKWLSWRIHVTHETLFTMRGAAAVILQHHQILRLPRKMTLQNFTEASRKQLKRHLQCATDPNWIRPWSENETVTPQPASQPRLLFTLTMSIFYWKIQHFALGLSFQISPHTAPATKSDSSTSPTTAPATKSDTWTSPNSAPATKSNTWTSPNSAPATKSNTTLLYPTLLFSTIRYSTLLFSTVRYYSLTNLISDESIPLRIYSLANLISNESLLKRI